MKSAGAPGSAGDEETYASEHFFAECHDVVQEGGLIDFNIFILISCMHLIYAY